jgi:site-specific DNA-methyltransferase (adenine-specific)
MLLWATKAPKGSKHRYTFNYDAMRNERPSKYEKHRTPNRQLKTVWTIAPPGREEKIYGKHPTQKPVALVSRCLRASTNPGDLVLDPFAGSGTTGVTALSLGRRFIGSELDAGFISIATRRLSDAVLARSEQSLVGAEAAPKKAVVGHGKK